MKIKIKKVCMWIICIQMMLVVIHVRFYNSFVNGNSLADAEPEYKSSFDAQTPVYRLKQQVNVTVLRVLTVKQLSEGDIRLNKSWNLSMGEAKSLERNTSNHQQSANASEGKELKIKNEPVKRKEKRRPGVGSLQTCTDIAFPMHLEKEEVWQPVDDQNAFVFSSYFVEKGRKIVITGTRTQQRFVYFCIFWKKEEGLNTAGQGSVVEKLLPEGHKLRYSSVLFECSLRSYAGIPSHVSLVNRPCGPPSNLLKVHMTTKPEHYPRCFTVCLTPLQFLYDNAYELIEWIELNRILGAEKFVIYNYSIANNVQKILDFYRKQGLVEMVQWRLPMEVRSFNGTKLPEIHYFGQVIALQDCLYRNKVYSEFIVNIDLDEFIIPRGENVNNWKQMLATLGNSSGAYIVRNTFFRKEWESTYIDRQDEVDKYRLVTLKKLHHEEEIFPVKRRSKYFARTGLVSQVMIHAVLFLPKINIAQQVPIEIALLHHYRDWENDITLPSEKVFDDTVPRKFGDKLIKNVKRVWSNLASLNINIPARL